MPRHAAKIHWSAPLGLLLLLAVGGGLWWVSNHPRQPGQIPAEVPAQDVVSAAVVKTAIEAVAASENGKYDLALGLWDELLRSKPGDADLLLNQAVTVLKWIDETSGRLSSGQVADPAQQSKLREELTAAFAKADATIGKVAKLARSDGRTAFLQATFFEAKARQAQPPDDQPLRQQAAQTLIDALSKNPAQPLLACKLDDLVQENSGEDPAMTQPSADALYASWRFDPRNLYVLGRAGDALLKNQDPRLKEILLPSLELAKPMLSMMKATLARVNPEELLTKASAAIETGDWRQVQQVRQWFNILKGTSGFRTDARLVKPDIMALLDTSFLNRFAEAQPVSDDAPAVTPVEYTPRTVSDAANATCWYDFDLNLDFDVVVARGKQLRLYITNPEVGIAGVLQQELDLPFAPTGMIPVDLYEVDNPARPRTPVTVAQLVQNSLDTPATSSVVSKEQIAKAKRHDTYQELVAWSDAGIAVIASVELSDGSSRQLKVLDNVPGLSGIDAIRQIESCDVDGDGDLDLIVACQSKMHILQNNGNRTFVDISEYSSLPGPDFHTLRMFACDIDRDLDQDVVLVNGQAGVFLLENILHSQFRIRKLEGTGWHNVGPSVDVCGADLDGNSSWDVATVGGQGVNQVLTRTPAMGQWLGTQAVYSNTPAGTRLSISDLNNDADLDLLVANDRGLHVIWGTGGGTGFGNATVISPGNATTLAAIDANGDGAIEVLSIIDGQATLLTPTKAFGGNYVAARARGINDSNGGGRINHYAVGSTLELWSSGKMQARVIRDPVTHFGIAQQKPDSLRIIFNNGLTQNVSPVQANTLIEELQELKGSCPFVYGWDGQRFQLITDLLWNAPLGLQVARGEVLPDRRWEYLMLPGELVQPKDGRYELRFTEELWEVAYFDRIALTAIDHPADIDVFSNEKVGPPSIATPAIFTAQHKLFPRTATDSQGRDCLANLAKVDRDFVQAFDELICQGLADPHFIELDFGTLANDKPWRLFLNGWMHPADTSLNIAMSQNPDRRGPEPPSLWVVDREGKWVCAQAFMGFPGGKPKSIVIDLAGVFQSDDHRIRIASSQQLYWDQAFVAYDSSSENFQETQLELRSAELRYRGFGRLLPRAPDQPHWYDYQTVSRTAKWPELMGPFTRFGDVKDLLLTDDDRMVVMVSGDEFVARFDLPDRPLPEGWRRDFLLHSVGWDKDADLNTLAGDGSMPLPFKAMLAYPPPIEQTDTAEAVLEQNKYHLTRMRQQQSGL